MRALWLVVTIVVVACGSAPKREPISNATPAPVDVRLDIEGLHDRLALGIPLELELRLLSTDAHVGTCTLSFDLWDEVYRVALSRHDVSIAEDATVARRHAAPARARSKRHGARRRARVEAHPALRTAALSCLLGPVF